MYPSDGHEQIDHFNAVTVANRGAIRQYYGDRSCIATAHFVMVQIFIEGLKAEIKNEMMKTNWSSLNEAFIKAEQLERLAEQRRISSGIKVDEVQVDYVGKNKTTKSAPYNEKKCRKCSKTGHLSDTCWIAHPHLKPSSKKKTGQKQTRTDFKCNYCLKPGHYAKDCKTRISRGAAIPLEDIEAGHYNEDYFQTPHSTTKRAVDSVSSVYNPKN